MAPDSSIYEGYGFTADVDLVVLGNNLSQSFVFLSCYFLQPSAFKVVNHDLGRYA